MLFINMIIEIYFFRHILYFLDTYDKRYLNSS